MNHDQDFHSEKFWESGVLRCEVSWQDEILENQPTKEKESMCKDIRK